MYLRANKRHNYISLSTPININNGMDEIPLEETICDNSDFVEDILNHESSKEVLSYLSIFSDRDQTILKYFFGIETPRKSQKQIAAMLGISQSYVSRIINTSVMKLRLAYQNDKTYTRIKKSQES